jgi:ABC-type tungstate transport system permease subunit
MHNASYVLCKEMVLFMKRIKLLLLIVLAAFFSSISFAQGVDSRLVSAEPKEVYSAPSEIKVRIGNGGAGPTGILRALAEDYFSLTHKKMSIAWYQDISTNTLKQLKAGNIDIALVYEPKEVKKYLSKKWATGGMRIFNDHFIIVGPDSNPAGLTAQDTPAEAFLKIAHYASVHPSNGKMLFLSRNDQSGTNQKEQLIWLQNNLKPWRNASWYKKFSVFPSDALLEADKYSLYTLTDYGTWLSNFNRIRNSKIYVSGGKDLNNACYALLKEHPSPEAKAFLHYLLSPRAQKVIADFGKNRYQGFPLFTSAQQLDFKHWLNKG